MIDRDGSPFSQQKRGGLLRTAIYVDAENIKTPSATPSSPAM